MTPWLVIAMVAIPGFIIIVLGIAWAIAFWGKREDDDE